MNKEEIKAGLAQIKGEKQEQMSEMVADIEVLKSGIVLIDDLSVGIEQLEMDAYKKGQDSMVLPDPSGTDKLYSQAEADQIAAQSKADGKAEAELAAQAEILAASQAKEDALAQAAAKQAELDAEKAAHEAYKLANIAQAQS
jgi:hypothetical protein